MRLSPYLQNPVPCRFKYFLLLSNNAWTFVLPLHNKLMYTQPPTLFTHVHLTTCSCYFLAIVTVLAILCLHPPLVYCVLFKIIIIDCFLLKIIIKLLSLPLWTTIFFPKILSLSTSFAASHCLIYFPWAPHLWVGRRYKSIFKYIWK